MKGKLLNIAISTFVCLAMVLGFVAAFTPTVAVAESYGTPGIDVIASIDEPNQGRYNVALETDIVALNQAADGTLFAGVYDTSSERWDITVSTVDYSRDYAVFFSSNGYDWTQGFIIPWDDNTEIVEIIPVPDYSATNAIVYMATEDYVYISRDGAKTFTRTNQNVPGIIDGDTITSIDVAKNCDNSGVSCATCGYVCVVGTEGGVASGVYTWNEDGFASWRDKEIGNAPATTNMWDVYDVRLNPRWNQDAERVIIAATYDGTNTILTVRGTLGTWSVEALDAIIVAGACTGARMDFADDYHWINSPRTWVAIWGNAADDVYRITSIQSPGAPAVKRCNIQGGEDWEVYDVAVTGTGSSCIAWAAIDDPDNAGQLQAYRSENIAQFHPTWQPSQKPPIGGTGDVQLVWTSYGAYIAGDDGNSTSGVCKAVLGTAGWAWNGQGMIDTIVTSGDYLQTYYDYTAGAVWQEASPSFNGDKTIFFISNDYDNDDEQFVWRTGNGGDTWELIGMSELDQAEQTWTNDDWDWVSEEVIDPDSNWMSGYMFSLRCAPGFSNVAGGDQTIFLMAYDEDRENVGGYHEWIYKSTDAGNTWKPIIAMPDYADYLSNTAWCVVDDNTLIVADYEGYVFKTVNNGYAWTYGKPSAYDAYVTDLDYYKDPTLGLVVLVGLFDSYSDETDEVWISLDGGNWFEPVGTSLTVTDYYYQTGITMVGFDQNFNINRTVYGAAGGKLDEWEWQSDEAQWKKVGWEQYDAGLWRAEVKLESPDTSLWDEIVTTEDIIAYMPEIDTAYNEDMSPITRYFWPTDVEIGTDNTIYVPFVFTVFGTDEGSTYGRNTDGGFIRCLDGTLYPEEWMFVSDGMPRYGGLWTGSVATGSTYLFSIGYRYDYWSYNDLIDLRLLAYKDTLSGAGPAPVTPLDGVTGVGVLVTDTSVNVPLTWEAKGGASKYAWEVSEDAAFSNPVKGETSALSVTVLDLKPATDYYWHSRSIEPGASRWSTTQKFTTLIGGDTGAPMLITPAKGATISDALPLFTWDKVASASNYDIQISTNPNFDAQGIFVNEKLGNVDSYAPVEELANGKYYWQVRGTNAATDTETPWSSSSFTLDTGAGGLGTPAWVWVLIVLGVLLGIVVLVLILRTRRPV
jgi:hypothetical protein